MKFVKAEDLIEIDNSKKIIVEITIWDKLPQDFTVVFSENTSRPRSAKLFAHLKYTEKAYREKLAMPECFFA